MEAPGTLSRNRRTGNRVSASKIFTDVLEGSGTVPLPTAKPPARASGRLIEKRRRRPPTNRLPLNSLHQARHGIAARTDAVAVSCSAAALSFSTPLGGRQASSPCASNRCFS